MTWRQQFLKILRFEPTGEIPLPTLFQRFERETIKRWQREGLPKDIHLAQHFGFHRVDLVPLNISPIPPYERVQKEEVEEWRVGVERELTDIVGQKVDDLERRFPVQNERDWERFKKLLNPASPARYPRFWDDYKRRVKDRDYPLGLSLGSPFGWLMEWVGTVELSQLIRDNLSFVQGIAEYLADFLIQTTHRAVEELEIDFAMAHETAAYRGMNTLSLETVRRLMLKPYQQISEHIRAHKIESIFVEAQGNVNKLIPLWMEAGFNGVCPLEFASGMNPVKLRRQYGKELILIGGIDQNALAWGKRHIEDEVMGKIAILWNKGGYLPAPDRSISSEVALENYEYYLELLGKIGKIGC
jgi:uroporphyrinogen decarboxylase